MNDCKHDYETRRKFIKHGAAVSVGGIVGVAGCMDDVRDDDVGTREATGDGNYPEQPITAIVPWAQGGGTDRAMRATTPTWSGTLGTDFVVENFPGGSTQVGGERLHEAGGDGYTIAMWNMPQMQATWLFQDAPYDQGDFDYIGTHHHDPTMWFAPEGVPYDDMNGFIEYAENNDVTVGTTAAIGNTALSAVLVQDHYDIDLNLVNLEGGTPTRQATLAGDIDASVNQPWAFNPDHQGEVTALGTHTPEQTDLWEGAPSFAELGLDDLPLVDEGLGQWKLMVAPGGLREEHPDRFDTLVDSYAEVFEQDDFTERTSEQGNLDQILDYRGPEETAEEVEAVSEFMEEHAELLQAY